MPLSSLGTSGFSLPEEIWTTAFNELHQRIKRCFTRQGICYRAITYMQGFVEWISFPQIIVQNGFVPTFEHFC